MGNVDGKTKLKFVGFPLTRVSTAFYTAPIQFVDINVRVSYPFLHGFAR